MRIKHHLLGGCVAVGAMAIGGTGPALAQSEAAAEERDPNEIVVTATKREQSVQDVPISMLVVAGEELADDNIRDIKELSTRIPGMNYIESPTVAVLQLRGFASPANNPAADQTVAVYKDGIFAGRARQYQAPFFDVERLEVLRGPQGALLGKNTAAGALSIISAMPTDTFKAGVTSTYFFDLNGAETNAFVSGPLDDTVSARAAVHHYSTTKGWVFNTATGRSDPTSNIFSGRLTLDFHPGDSGNSTFRAEYSDVTYHGTAAANFPGNVPIQSVLAYRRNMPGVFGVEDGLKLQSLQISNNASFDIGNLTLVSITGFAHFDGTSVGGGGANNPEVFGTTLIEKFRQGSQELRLLSPTGQAFEWIVGAYGDIATYHSENVPRYTIGAINGQGRSYYDQSSRSVSVYGTGTYNITDALRGIVGARWTHITNHGQFAVRQEFGAPFGYAPGLTRDQRFSESHFDPSATIQYDVTPDVMVYAAWARGSKGGTFQSTNRTVLASEFSLKPERAESFEAGLKASFGGWLTMDVAVYQLTINDLQGSQYYGTPPTLRTVNVGSARTRGVEYSVTARPVKGLSLSAIGAYTDGEYVDYGGAACLYANLPPRGTCINGSINAAGRKLSVPLWSGSVSADYRGAISDSLDVFFSSEFNYRSRSNIDANVQNPFFGSQAPYGKLNGRIGFGAEDGRWEVALVGRNLLNKLTINSAIAWGPPFVSSQTVMVRIDPARSIGLQFKLAL